MPLNAGTQLGPYQVISPLGAGGMGEVYRARDTRLDREVALKVLPAHLSASPEQQQRFDREARVISQLSHPHICTLYDIGHQDGTTYLVMELLDGETLADRLTKGPLPPDRVLKVGIEIADALEAAHTHGIVHRDLKPANIMLTRSGVKLLDFGLAKPRAAVQGDLAAVSALPTEASPGQPLTERGTILGTFQYMAPEQLEGKEADARTDLFALGCVLFEMATGQKAFTGRSQVSLTGSILKDEPAPISSIVPLTPPALDHLVQSCLAKAPEDRLQTAHDAKLQLQWIEEAGSQGGASAIGTSRRAIRAKLTWVLLGVVAGAAFGVGYSVHTPKTAGPQARPARFQIPRPAGLVRMGEPKISPDGREVAFVGTDARGKAEIWLRALDSLKAHPLAGTEGVTTRARPFWSPDSRSLGYFVGTQLMRIPVDGGPPQKICDSPTEGDGTWGADGVILFDWSGDGPNAIRRVRATGGVPKVAVLGGKNGLSTVAWPQFLPGGQRFLFRNSGGKDADNGIWMGDLGTGRVHKVVSASSRAEFVPPGFLLFVRGSTLVAQGMDPVTGAVHGEPVPVADSIGPTPAGGARFSASRTGVIVYRTGLPRQDRLEWVDVKSGHVDTESNLGDGHSPAFSADGRWLAVSRVEGKSRNIWVRDLTRGVSSRFTTDAYNDYAPVFTPDGKSILFSRQTERGTWEIVSKGVDSGHERVLVPPALGFMRAPIATSPDGRRLLYTAEQSSGNLFGLFVTDLSQGGAGAAYVPPASDQITGSFSPDGRWLAYESDEPGRAEIFVQSFPEPGRKWQISTAGGTDPVWASNGHDLYYLAGDQMSGDHTLMKVEVTTGPRFDAGVPQPLFSIAVVPSFVTRSRLILSPDGTRFLVVAPSSDASVTPLTVILNWKAAIGQS